MNKIKDWESYKLGFKNGLDIKENYKYQIFGYDLDKILEVMGNYKMPTKSIMTREEAIALIRNVFRITDTGQGIRWIDFFIDAGMLKIRKEEKELSGLPIGFTFPFSKREEWTNCCNEMFKQGFVVINVKSPKKEDAPTWIALKDIDGNMQQVEISKIIYALEYIGYAVNKCNGED